MIDINYFEKSDLFQKIKFEHGLIDINICRIDEHPIHFNKHLEVILVMDGEISVKSSSSMFSLNKGDWLFLNAFEIHGIKSISDSALIACIHFDLGVHSAEESLLLYDSEVLKKEEQIYSDIRKRLVRIIDMVCFEKKDDEELYDYARNLMNFVNDNLKYVMYEISGEKNDFGENDLRLDRLDDILNYMYLHYDEKLSLEYIAKQFNVSKFYFSHLLKKCFNKSFREVLNIVRVDRAEVLILGSDKPMMQICNETGFSSYQYFVKQFKEYFGTTPMQYRKKYQKETIKYKPFRESPYSISPAELRLWLDENMSRKVDDMNPSLHINFNQGEYSIVTLMDSDEASLKTELKSFDLEKGTLVINADCDEILIKIKRKIQ